jgi:hypothetical protein
MVKRGEWECGIQLSRWRNDEVSQVGWIAMSLFDGIQEGNLFRI